MLLLLTRDLVKTSGQGPLLCELVSHVALQRGAAEAEHTRHVRIPVIYITIVFFELTKVAATWQQAGND